MTKNLTCYLRAQRLAWDLTQAELASLAGYAGPSGRNRVSLLELGKTEPKGAEILAYSLIFGCRPAKLFPKLCEDTEDAVMHGAVQLDKRLRPLTSPEASRKRHLLDLIGARATGKSSLTAA